ncbi:MAG: hypothetical protein AB9879_14885 [Methanothrix sp.]
MIRVTKLVITQEPHCSKGEFIGPASQRACHRDEIKPGRQYARH